MLLFSASVLWYGFSQGFVIGPISLYGIREGLNPKRGFWGQMQVILGATLVDIVYLLASTYGVAQIIQYDFPQLLLWSIGAYMLITMGVNSYHERPGRMNFAHMHRHKLRFFDTDFFKAISMNMVNPMAILFAVVIFGGMYADFSNVLTPFAFAMNVTVGGLLSSCTVALLTFAVRHVFHRWMLTRLMQAGSLVLIGYGLWFMWKAVQFVPDVSVSLIHLFQ